MGGQACVFYGAAEFSRDTDLLVLQREFWLSELRTPELIIEAAQAAPDVAARLRSKRPLLQLAQPGKHAELTRALQEEESAERERDRAYWQPLKLELEQLRRAKLKGRT